MKLCRMSVVRKYAVALVGAAAVVFAASADTPDTLYFVTGGSLGSTEILSTSAANPTTVFEGANLGDYEPVYAYFNLHNPGGQKWNVSQDIEQEILRPYNVTRATEDGAATMTVQFQGVTRFHVGPHTASITIKFTQSGENIVAYVVRAAALKPLDVELGLDLDAMVDNSDPRVVSKPLTGDGRYNISVITMRKPAATVEYTVHDGASISDTLAGNGAVSVTSEEVDIVNYSSYLPNNSYVVVAENRDLADLDEVEGFYHTGANAGVQQTAYQFKYTALTNELGRKTCQFQVVNGRYICAIRVRFRQNGANVEAETDQWANYYMDTTGYADEVYLGMDFEKYVRGGTPDRCCYNNLGTSDDAGARGIKNLILKFKKHPSVTHEGYLPNGYDQGIPQSWTVVARNHQLSDLESVEAFYHTGANTGIHAPGLNLNISGDTGSCQFQRTMSSYIKCVCVDLRQNGANIEASTGRYRNWHIYYDGRTKWDEPTGTIDPRVVYGVDFLTYGTGRQTYGSYGADDSSGSEGVKNLRLKFKTGGVTYAAASTAPYGNNLTFSGSADTPLVAKTVSSTTFPSNGVVTVAPYADLTLSGHVDNPMWTQYRVMTNGVLRMKGTWQTRNYDAIDLVGGTLSCREGETANDSGTYISYLTLMNGAHVRGKPVRVGHQAVRGNWLVTGDSPSYCESGIEFTAAGGNTERTFWLDVNDVAEGPDFFVSGDLVDYGTLQNDNGYWNAHVIKDGAGTMELSGGITLPNEICVSNGVVRIADGCTFSVSRKRSTANGDGSEKVAEIWLAGGALETAAGTTNTIGAVVAKAKDAPLNLGAGSKLTLASFSRDAGASLLVSGDLGNGVDICIESERLNVGKVIRGIRCGADRKCVKVGAGGNLEPYTPGMTILIK
ncbi:MAG: hypothetical protein IJI35_11900 [Kiritimatiellae bacterium]|nr:hypothetical protein [Kiritimatiellia bacterium]